MTESHPTERALPHKRLLLARAWVLLMVGTVLQRGVPMTWWDHLLGVPGIVSQPEPVTRVGEEHTKTRHTALMDALNTASSVLPWTPSCLARAFAAQRILASWNSPGEVFIGLKRGADDQWPIHAWLIHHGETITGQLEQESYAPATVFRMPPKTSHHTR